MASAITIKVATSTHGEAKLETLTRRALNVFHDVEEACTRFKSSSPLMRANATPTRWHRVPPVLFRALEEAYDAYQRTYGIFDPRVLSDLESLGYDASLRFGSGDVHLGSRDEDATRRGVWKPRFRAHKNDVWLGESVELGGIGKGLAVRWASEILASQLTDYLVEAGGDCFLAGHAPDGGPWRVGVEDALGGDTPVAVLSVSDHAVATSSTRLRHWRVGEQSVHHLIDPRTRRSGGEGLAAVTVVGADPAHAEVDAKALFLAGRDNVSQVALARLTAALWCDVEGGVTFSPAMRPFVYWERA
jgi:thiamine biosynthesis lipoprotein